MELEVKCGAASAGDEKRSRTADGSAIDSLFSPVTPVRYAVETRASASARITDG